MRREGYGAVSTRRVAAEAGLKASHVFYYYPTLDDLLLAFYLRTVERTQRQLTAALASDRPLHALWRMNIDAERSALAAEFVALANHRKAIAAEIVRNVVNLREAQARAIAAAVATARVNNQKVDPLVATVLLATVGVGLALEGQVGISMGHDGVRAFVENLIDLLEPSGERKAVRG